MLGSLLVLIIDTVLGFVTLMLLARFFMQVGRVPFRNPLGQFVFATTDWLVLRMRRVVPPLFGLDTASFLPAWVLQTLAVLAQVAVQGSLAAGSPLGWLLVLWGVGLLEVFRMVLFLLLGVVLMSAILSWVNPYSPVAPVINAMAEPFLRPLRRVIPLIGNVDLSPLVFLLLIQVAQTVLAYVRAGVLASVMLF